MHLLTNQHRLKTVQKTKIYLICSKTAPAFGQWIIRIDDVSAEYILNTDQSRAFRLIVERGLDKSGQPLRMFRGGPGGTGKFRVINALTDVFTRRSQVRWFRFASYTDVATRNISGITLHAALNLGQKSKFGMNSRPAEI